MAVTWFSEADVDRLVDMQTAVEVVENAFRALAEGQADNVPRQRAKGSGIILHSMSAAAAYLGYAGWKQYTTTRHGARFLVGLYEQSSGNLVALLEADRLGQMRTGAATGVAVRHLALPEADRVGLFGCGWQAQTQLEAIVAVRPIRQAVVYCRTESRRESFATSMRDRCGIDVVAARNPEQAVRDLPIVVTATTSREPVFEGDWLAPGVLVCAVGSNWLNRTELDLDTIRHVQRIVCDSVPACQIEAGDLAPAAEMGLFDWEQALELGRIILDPSLGRHAPSDRIVFKSVGLAVQDVALAVEVLRRFRVASLT